MKKVLNILVKFFFTLWQLPQECVGFFLLLWYYSRGKATKATSYKSAYVFCVPTMNGGVSLGQFLFVCKQNYTLIKHEYGHFKQSRILGPFYLFVIGIPSFIWAMLWKPEWKKDYYSFYTESWADKLGGVVGR